MPILRLAGAAQRVSLERNYAVRVTKSANDELGTLYDQFNAMLDQIQQGEAAIQRAHDELEIKVEQRTAELSRANQELSREVTERLRAEEGLEAAHQELMVSARAPEWRRSPRGYCTTSATCSIASMCRPRWLPTVCGSRNQPTSCAPRT